MTKDEMTQYIAENQIDISDKFIRELIDYELNEYNEVLPYEKAKQQAQQLHDQGCLCHTVICWDCKAHHDGCCPCYLE